MTFEGVIKLKLPYLDLSDAVTSDLVSTALIQTQYLFQECLEKTSTEVEDQASYTKLETSFIGTYTAFTLVKTKAVSAVAGDSEAGTEGDPTLLKKAKADVVEVEFSQAKSTDAGIFTNRKDLMDDLKEELCQIAPKLKIHLDLCECEDDYALPFIVTNG